MLALCVQSCCTTRRASERLRVEGSELREIETRDSLREEISQNLNENLAEHEVVTWTIVGLPLTADGLQSPLEDTVKVERVTDRTKFQVSSSRFQDSKMAVRTEVVRDTVYVERKDSVLVQGSRFKVSGDSLNSRPSTLILTLKWLFALICAIVVLIIVVRIGLAFGSPPSRKA